MNNEPKLISKTLNDKVSKCLNYKESYDSFSWFGIVFYRHPIYKRVYASKCGRVVSFRQSPYKDCNFLITKVSKRAVKYAKTGNSYCSITVNMDGKAEAVSASRFVKECIDKTVYRGNGVNMKCVNGNTLDCAYDNWEWSKVGNNVVGW